MSRRQLASEAADKLAQSNKQLKARSTTMNSPENHNSQNECFLSMNATGQLNVVSQDWRSPLNIPALEIEPGKIVPHPEVVASMIKVKVARRVGGFDARWTEPIYSVAYRIGAIEEVISFSPEDVEDAMQLVGLGFVRHFESEKDFLAQVDSFIRETQRYFLDFLELYVRKKHSLPIGDAAIDPTVQKDTEELIAAAPSQRTAKDHFFWRMMIFAGATTLFYREGNCLVINDRSVTERELQKR
jgi:hypothetical protein